MTGGRERRRLSIAAAALLAAVALVLGSPGQPRAASADCGENTGPVCSENESCAHILFYKQCTTEYEYYPQSESGGGDEDDRLDEPESNDCDWGLGYIGWEPLDC